VDIAPAKAVVTH